MNLDAVNEYLSWHPSPKCRTCGGAVRLSAKQVHDGILVSANCHGMWSVFLVSSGRSDQGFFDWLSGCARLPERVPEYDVDYSAPVVKEETRLTVSERTASAARLGAEMQIMGVRGRVCGIDRMDPAIVLGPTP